MPYGNPAKRQHIVETAYALFQSEGFRATGIDRIITEAAVAKMTMYRHFPSKDDLVVAVLADRAERFERRLDARDERVMSAAERIGAIVDTYDAWFRSPDFKGCLFAHALAEYGDPAHPVHRAVMEHRERLQRRMGGFLRADHTQGTAHRLAAQVLMILDGATLLAQTGQVGLAASAAREAVSVMIVSGAGQGR